MRSHSQPVALERLGIVLDRDAEVPLGVQLVWALRARVHDGRLAPGERLPALRDLAEGLGVNANTIRTVYQRLEHEGLLSSLQGSGTFVTAGPRERSAVGAIAEAAALEARETGVDPRAVAAALYVAQGNPTDTGARVRSELGETEDSQVPSAITEEGARAGRRRLLRTRIAALEQALAELEVQHPRLARVARSGERRPGAGPRLLDSEELEQVQTELLRRIAAIQMAIDDRVEGAKPEAAPPAKPKAALAGKPTARRRATTRPAATGS
jgi:GntR family transcriptional regulator